MNDTAGKTASSLAITEKKPHRPGGCVGIFFQLFDWNRRFAKKKLFSKKLLPPARAKQASKKFGGDEKLPKFRLIADENSGGFPNVKKNGTRNVDSEQKYETGAPSLVARLMGLESMPPAQQDKLKKASFSEFGSDRGEKFVSNHSGFTKEDLNLEKGNVKHEFRPQKLQKTGLFERQPVTRFGAEALQFKSVLSRSKKHHPRLASPMKSPRMLSGRNKSRFIDAATKILEPGLQATNRAKCALTYSNIMHHAPKDDIMMEGTLALPQDLLENSNYYASAGKSPKGQSSCKNCGRHQFLVPLCQVMSTLLLMGQKGVSQDNQYPHPRKSRSKFCRKVRSNPFLLLLKQGMTYELVLNPLQIEGLLIKAVKFSAR
uniref:DUF3741 domain-containing protein n=1 Tax=Davidia involucrata TaxID=16924 RepID=A0A5B6Z2N9_DAVIN